MDTECLPRRTTAFAVWIAGNAIGWLVGSPLLAAPTISHPGQIIPLSAAVAAVGFLVSTPVGIVGWLALRRYLSNPWAWLASTVLGLPFGLGVGFLANAYFLYHQVHSMGMALSGEGGGAEMWPPVPITMAVAGFVVAAAQVPFLAARISSNWRRRALWLFGSVVAFDVGWFTSAWLASVGRLGSPAQGALMGAISGAILLLLLLFLESQARRPTSPLSRLVGRPQAA